MAQSPTAPAAATWAKHLAPDGRPYWTRGSESVWEKPRELKTEAEVEMEGTDWKEYESGGRPYWVSKSSGTTTWERPQAIQEILDRFAAAAAPPAPVRAAPPLNAPTGPASFVASQQQSPPPGASPSAPLNGMSGALVAPGGFIPGGPGQGMPVPMRPQQPMLGPGGIPNFQTQQEAERAFMAMLKTIGVNASWTWEQVMRETITDPMYKALKTLAERKTAFEKYVVESKREEKEERERSLEEWRKEWFKGMEKIGGGLSMEGGVKSWWSWERGSKAMEAKNPEVWKGPRNDEERKTLFNEFIENLKKKEETRKRDLRTKNMGKLTKILQSLSLDLAGSVRWHEAQATIYRTPEWHRDPELQKIEPIDVLAVYEEEVRKAESEAAQTRVRAAEEKRRRARKAREDFVYLLEDLKAANHIVAGTTWKSIYPLISDDPRFLNLLGVLGSSPLDLFWDVVDALDFQAEEDQRIVESVLASKKSPVVEKTTWEEFEETIKGEERVAQLEPATLRLAFEKLHARAVRTAKDDRRRAEKKLRLQIDDLRYAFKKLDPPVDLEATFEDVIPRIQDTEEYKALEDEASRRTAFEKFVRRQKEKLKEREKEDADRSRSHRDDHKSSSRRRGSSAHRERAGSEETGVKRAASREVAGDDERRSKMARVEKKEDGEPFSAQEVEMMDATTAGEPDEPEEGEI